MLYVESIDRRAPLHDARRAPSRAASRSWPTRPGASPSRRRPPPRTPGALASEDEVYDAAFARAGIARVYEIADIFDCAELVGRHKPPAGPRLGIVTNAGGPGVMATDALIARRGVLAELAPETLAALDEALPPAWSHGNPVDVLGDASSKRFAKAAELVLADPGVDAVLVILTPQAMTNPTATATRAGRAGGEVAQADPGRVAGRGQHARGRRRSSAAPACPATARPRRRCRRS